MPDCPSSEQARRWRLKAEECRAVAELMEDAIAKASFRRMAQTYDGMANGLEEMAALSLSKKPATS